jgi:formylglycine-generating enzyme required for sulfatase activity
MKKLTIVSITSVFCMIAITAVAQEQALINGNMESGGFGPGGTPMVLIAAGEFEMGNMSNEGKPDERPVHTVYLDAFYMDVYEVTNSQYAGFLNEYGKNTDDAGHELLNVSGKYCLIEKVGDTYKPKDGYENHPVVEVSWYGAVAYAQFYGKRLPTEAEWEKAARGGLVGKQYPWEDNVSHNHANYAGIGGKDDWERTSPVGSFAPNGYGLYNMVGNVSDWCADWYNPGYYAGSLKQNPQGPDSGYFRVVRGGGWHLKDPYYLRVTYRSGRPPVDTLSYVGFRCVTGLNAAL